LGETDGPDVLEDAAGDNAGFYPVDESKGRCKASKLLLTFPQCGASLSDIWDYFQRTNFNGLNKSPILAFGTTERHRDGNPHVHLFISWGRPFHYYPATTFNVLFGERRYHPNVAISRDKAKTHDRIFHYLAKQGSSPTILTGKFDLFNVSRDFTNKKRDWDNWLAYRREVSRVPFRWEDIRDPRGRQIPKPDEAKKNRHLWIWGTSNTRKTTWGKQTLPKEHTLLYTSRDSWEDYNGEQIIWFDDSYPIWGDLQAVCETTKKGQDRNIPYRTRYGNRVLLGGQVRLIIVTTNLSIDRHLETTKLEPEEKIAYKNRFTEIEITQPIDTGSLVRVADYDDEELNGIGEVIFIDIEPETVLNHH